ncbi:hypothetical protein LSAT2_005987 [Lamellibrachia satsuma]|nr:hypothetical protein LSAT2_005987 [Lamellibrachia satsuma]
MESPNRVFRIECHTKSKWQRRGNHAEANPAEQIDRWKVHPVGLFLASSLLMGSIEQNPATDTPTKANSGPLVTSTRVPSTLRETTKAPAPNHDITCTLCNKPTADENGSIQCALNNSNIHLACVKA